MLQMGYGQAEITPTLDSKRPVYLAGFGHNRAAQEVHDELYARALALSDGQTTLVLCALDLIGFFRSDVQAVLRTLEASDSFRALKPQVKKTITTRSIRSGQESITKKPIRSAKRLRQA
jgi:hypothetical protein